MHIFDKIGCVGRTVARGCGAFVVIGNVLECALTANAFWKIVDGLFADVGAFFAGASGFFADVGGFFAVVGGFFAVARVRARDRRCRRCPMSVVADRDIIRFLGWTLAFFPSRGSDARDDEIVSVESCEKRVLAE